MEQATRVLAWILPIVGEEIIKAVISSPFVRSMARRGAMYIIETARVAIVSVEVNRREGKLRETPIWKYVALVRRWLVLHVKQ